MTSAKSSSAETAAGGGIQTDARDLAGPIEERLQYQEYCQTLSSRIFDSPES